MAPLTDKESSMYYHNPHDAKACLRMMEKSTTPDWGMYLLYAWATSIIWLPILVWLVK